MKVIDVVGVQNKSKYAQAPSWEQIEILMTEMELSLYHFEKFYGMPYNSLIQVKKGERKLAAKYWHYVYEKIKPAYGAGFLGDSTTKTNKNRINTQLIPDLTEQNTTKANLHSRISSLNKDS